MSRSVKRAVWLTAVLGALVPASAQAQLDPLLFLKTTPPNVILAVDTSQRMQFDADGAYYDPRDYSVQALLNGPLGLSGATAAKFYRRKYVAFQYLAVKYGASRITAVGDLEAGYATFYDRTRLVVARRALAQAVTANTRSGRFALIRTRQGTPTLPAAGNDGPVLISDSSQAAPTDFGAATWKVTRTTVTGNNSAQVTSGLLTAADAAGANATIAATLAKDLGTAGALLAAGNDAQNVVDSPTGLLLDDARAHASTLIAADAAANGCRNTIVVLVTGGGEGTISPQNLATKATTFLNVSGRRVPIYVVAIYPTASEATTLRTVATNSGGQYFEITKAMVEATTAGTAVAEVVRAVNLAVQHAVVPSTTFNTAPTAELPFGPYGEFQVTSPIIGTVKLRGASKITATGTELLPDSETVLSNGSSEIPQRSNVMVTTGFQLPGFEAKLRAFRVYKPVADASKPSGYRFTQDGSRLWVSSTPAAGSRNIYTVLPGSSTLEPFTAANVAKFQSYLNVADPATLVDYIRSQPMGDVVGSTPAFIDAPSLDPPPDAEYPGFRDDNKNRRALIVVGANDGMLHVLDARTGVEVWAFIPFNLLPKLRALRAGQPLDDHNYFVDSSPKVSDVKVGDKWRTYLFFGQGAGGTFYNTLDITLDKIADSIAPDSSDTNALLNYFANDKAIEWKWSFPRNTSFDASIRTATSPYGELKLATASATELTVGETWSDPAIGQIVDETGPYVMAVGSGFLKYSVQLANRPGVTRAGTTFYLLDVETGDVVGTPRDVGADGIAETVDNCVVANDCRRIKNALQMDPVATGVRDSRYISMVYIGDLDGKVWKFTITKSGSSITVSTPTQLYSAGADYPMFASMATVSVGGSQQYIFIGTGSDLLPSPDALNKPQTSSLLVLLDNGASATKTAEILLEPIDGAAGEEKVTAFPAVAGDIVFFTTTTSNVTTPCTPFTANLYAFTFIGGPAYDTNGDGKLSGPTTTTTGKGKTKTTTTTPGDSQKVFSVAGQRATAPFIVDQHLVFSAGGNIQMFGDPDDFNNGVGQAGVRILSWRAVK